MAEWEIALGGKTGMGGNYMKSETENNKHSENRKVEKSKNQNSKQ